MALTCYSCKMPIYLPNVDWKINTTSLWKFYESKACGHSKHRLMVEAGHTFLVCFAFKTDKLSW